MNEILRFEIPNTTMVNSTNETVTFKADSSANLCSGAYMPPVSYVTIGALPVPIPDTSGEQVMSAKLTQPSLDAIRALVREEVRKALQGKWVEQSK